ncbi:MULTISPECIES: NAD-dependent succinate-semialdehyde dehydrogenase [Desulfococcus]|uniref:Succinic semialdehyde dehydrogenase n=1 Tax=Desulfococcus multivorans DSM 2059 TaxID=1121405 RepID=S7TUT6_DESML|nr:NAD-dependent succinate-semialdehyde dehydrogenase [Desulfococcus multivorans]AOY57042.1 GabD: NADP-dependent succinate-semialdehyde dehydrogenase [Desulfococcus multivorans]AQU99557.1 NAD-dependent succinate-semialdehyde dehydrogenase [Desulfococcus multivorans]EPR40761.1 succinic semialdehyde dehydrogenase [Desulfococcus multivorans DSM 2059]MDX9817598.1 NAD-dependent succinate-semialdehyde dehydrogenase [Desulfococcus multivorans]SJZ88918.1 succinate-semialdehyde dehydrogenase / glutarat
MVKLTETRLLRQQCYINGEWQSAAAEATFPVTNPADGAVLAEVPDMGTEEVRAAVGAAQAAWSGWRGRTAGDRAAVLRRWYDLIMANQEDLAALMTAEQGKPLGESRGEIAYAASFVEWFAEEGKRIYGDTIPAHRADTRIVVIKAPVGVCAAITPWNFPSAMITRKAAPALAAGCTMVVKPAGQTPLSALALAELADQAGIPPGVFNVVTGDSAVIGKALTDDPRVRKLSFTGSTETGKLLMRACAGTVKKISLELGGNAPFIVFDDADLDRAVEGAVSCKYRNSGQTCVCANRILVQDAVYDAFVGKFTAAVKSLKVADGFTEGAEQGPLIDMKAVEKSERLIRDALDKGATLLLGGKRHALGGTFFEPTILGNAVPAMRIAAEETFGPVAPVFRFRTETAAVDLANDTPYGLAAYFYSRDLGRVWRVAESLEYGMVGINTGIISTAAAPFGGIKESGIGREGSHYGIDEYVEIKYLCMGDVG